MQTADEKRKVKKINNVKNIHLYTQNIRMPIIEKPTMLNMQEIEMKIKVTLYG